MIFDSQPNTLLAGQVDLRLELRKELPHPVRELFPRELAIFGFTHHHASAALADELGIRRESLHVAARAIRGPAADLELVPRQQSPKAVCPEHLSLRQVAALAEGAPKIDADESEPCGLFAKGRKRKVGKHDGGKRQARTPGSFAGSLLSGAEGSRWNQ